MNSNAKQSLIGAGVVAGATLLWFEMKPAPPPVGEWREATVAPQVAKVEKEAIQPPHVAVYAPTAKQKLNLPDAIETDAHQHVLDAAHLQASDHPQTVTTVIDDQSGATQTLVRSEPLPWLAAEQRGELRIDYGIKRGMQKVLRLSLNEDLVEVKALHAGLSASLDTDGALFVGGGVGWRW